MSFRKLPPAFQAKRPATRSRIHAHIEEDFRLSIGVLSEIIPQQCPPKASHPNSSSDPANRINTLQIRATLHANLQIQAENAVPLPTSAHR